MDYVSPDGSFGFGGFDDEVGEEVMIDMLMPVIHEVGKEALMDAELVSQIDASMLSRHPDFLNDEEDEIPPQHIVCAVLAIKKYNLLLDDVADKLYDGSIVQWVFQEFLKQNSGDLDQVFSGHPAVSIDIGETVKVGDTGDIPEDVKVQMMMSLVNEFQTLLTSKDEHFNYLFNKMHGHLKPLYLKEDFPVIGTFAVMLNWHFKVDFKECVKLALDGTVIDVCYKKFLEETGTQLASSMMGEPPSTSLN